MESWIPPEQAINRIVFSEDQIQQRVSQLAAEINNSYAGKSLVVIGIMKGAFVFLADLCRKLTIPHTIELLAVSSYGNAAKSSGNVKIVMDCREDIIGKDVLIVEDIVDTGLTLQYLLELLKSRKPASVETCVFLQKAACLKVPNLKPRFIGFQIEPIFVVGYGLDYAEKYRTLPYIGELKEEIYKK